MVVEKYYTKEIVDEYKAKECQCEDCDCQECEEDKEDE